MEKNYLDRRIKGGLRHMWLVICMLTLVVSVSACAAAVLMQEPQGQSEV
jgi:hypothetical protein